MVLTLYGFIHSTNTQRVAVVLKENNVPFKFVSIDLQKGEQKSPEYLAKQPFGVVLCIVSLLMLAANGNHRYLCCN